jgi:hypothetical protein
LDDQANTIKFMARQGTGKALMEMYREHFKSAGWKEENFLLEALFGTLAVRNEADHSIDIDFVDTGLEAEFELTINGFGVDLEATPTPAGEQTRGASK